MLGRMHARACHRVAGIRILLDSGVSMTDARFMQRFFRTLLPVPAACVLRHRWLDFFIPIKYSRGYEKFQ